MKTPVLFAAAALLLTACNNDPHSAPAVHNRTAVAPPKVVAAQHDSKVEPLNIAQGTKADEQAAAAAPHDEQPLSPKEKAALTAYHAYIKGYISAQLPLVLNSHTSRKFSVPVGDTYPEPMSYKYAGYVPEMAASAESRFSREGPKPFYCLAKVAATANYTAVVYAFQAFNEYDAGPYAYTLVTYDNRGRIIDKLWAGQRDIKGAYRVVTIKPDLQIEAKDFNEKWAKDPSENGYSDNKVVASALVRNARYHITDDGRIQRDDVLVGMK